ncbi:MAG: hypothetical protein J6N70_19250, partial [Oribacterium sp.]|nr:hypothetical protein [Oribacterium sp.]
DILESCDVVPNKTGLFYDLDLNPSDAMKTRQLMDFIEPMGKGLEEPLFQITANISEYRRFGGGKEGKKKNCHVGFNLSGLDVVWWNGADIYFDEMHMPKNVKIYGNLKWNTYGNVPKLQFTISDMVA